MNDRRASADFSRIAQSYDPVPTARTTERHIISPTRSALCLAVSVARASKSKTNAIGLHQVMSSMAWPGVMPVVVKQADSCCCPVDRFLLSWPDGVGGAAFSYIGHRAAILF
jgi:hypothetical protein